MDNDTNIKAKWLKASGEVVEVEPAIPPHFSLKEMQKYVGGYIQILNPSSHGTLLVINEEGKILDLPVNLLATECWAKFAIPGDAIVGDVLLCHRSQLE